LWPAGRWPAGPPEYRLRDLIGSIAIDSQTGGTPPNRNAQIRLQELVKLNEELHLAIKAMVGQGKQLTPAQTQAATGAAMQGDNAQLLFALKSLAPAA